MDPEDQKKYNWAIALPVSGMVISQAGYTEALHIKMELHQVGVYIPLLREPLEGGPYEEVKVTFVGYGDD